MSENVTVNTYPRLLVITLDGTAAGNITAFTVVSRQFYSNGVVRDLPPHDEPVENIANFLSDSALSALLTSVIQQHVARNIPLPEMPQ